MCSNSAILCSTNSRSGILAWSDTLLHLKHYHWIRSQYSDSLTVQSIVRELLLIAFRVAFATLVGDDIKFVRMSAKLFKRKFGENSLCWRRNHSILTKMTINEATYFLQIRPNGIGASESSWRPSLVGTVLVAWSYNVFLMSRDIIIITLWAGFKLVWP